MHFHPRGVEAETSPTFRQIHTHVAELPARGRRGAVREDHHTERERCIDTDEVANIFPGSESPRGKHRAGIVILSHRRRICSSRTA